MRNVFFSPSRRPSLSPPQTPSRRSFSASLMDENLEIADQIINTWNLEKANSYTQIAYLFADYRSEAKEFLRSVNGLQSAMHFFLSEGTSTEKLIHAQNLMQIAIKRLEREFYQILLKKRSFLEPESISISISSRSSRSSLSDDDDVAEEDDSDSPSQQAMDDLKSIADTMIFTGYGKECVKIYKLVRKSIVDESLYNLGIIEILSLSQMQKMDWEAIESKIKIWLKGVKIAVNTIFQGEKTLCDHVFGTSSATSESCFSEIANGGAQNLFVFPENIAKCKKLTPEKMFRILDTYTVLSDLLPEIEFTFSSTATSSVKSQAVNSLLKLREAVKTMLTEFEAAIQKETTKSPLPGGGIHPLTRYVMNYLVFLSDYNAVLADIIDDWPLVIQSPLPDSYFPSENQKSGLNIRLSWLLLVLLCKLDAKAELYRDVSLSYLFLANNLNYVVSKVKSSNLVFLIGDEWVSQHVAKMNQYACSYERIGWGKVTSSFPDPTVNNNNNNNIPPQALRDCFKRFNTAFEDTCRKQRGWIVPGDELRAEIKARLENSVVGMYRRFYETYREVFRGVGDEESIIRFAPEDVEICLFGLFKNNNNNNGPAGDTASFSSGAFSSTSSRDGHVR